MKITNEIVLLLAWWLFVHSIYRNIDCLVDAFHKPPYAAKNGRVW